MILASTLAAKANSKREIHQFLSVGAAIYLPKVQHVTIYFLKDIMSGYRKGRSILHVINHLIGVSNKKVFNIYCPQYETLSLKKVFKFITDYSDCFIYFPAQ